MPSDLLRSVIRLGLGGMNLSRDTTLIDERKLALARNMRVYRTGELVVRPGLSGPVVTTSTSPLHSVRRLNDSTSGSSDFTYVIGSGAKLEAGKSGAASVLATGFSGNPLRLIPFRPDKSSRPFMYVLDSLKQGKTDIFGNYSQVGITTPISAPSAYQSRQPYKTISILDDTTSWTQGGTANAPTLLSAGPGRRIDFTIPAGPPAGILYDSGSTGWASLIPGTMNSNFQPGSFIKFTGGTAETAIIDKVLPAAPSLTISSISYDSGTTGLCTIQFSAPTYDLVTDGILLLDNGTKEYVRILSVTTSPLSLPSVRVSTTLAHTASSTCSGAGSFRAYLASAHSSGETVRIDGVRFTTTGAGIGTLSLTTSLDLTQTSTGATRPLGDEDEIHISIRLDNAALLTEGQILFNIDATDTSFSQNAFYFSFNPSAFVGAVKQTTTTLTAEQIAIQRGEIRRYQTKYDGDLYASDGRVFGDYGSSGEYYNPETGSYQSYPYVPSSPVYTAPTETPTGDSQWFELVAKVKDFKRIGTDTSRTWKNVNAIRVQVNTSAAITTDLSSWWIGGSWGPDVGDAGADYNYVYTWRGTYGAESNPSPPMRAGVRPRRQAVDVTVTGTSDSQVGFIDVWRFGGTLSDFYYVGTVTNPGTSSSVTFTDALSDIEINANRILRRDRYVPFPVLDSPRSGVCNVTGTKVTRISGDNFNVNWAPGTAIIFTDASNGTSTIYYLYSQPADSSVLELTESAGSQTNLRWSIPEPLILNQIVPSWFGPWGGGFAQLYFFAVGDTLNPGRLYWTNPSDPDSASASGSLEVTSGSEVLIGGTIYDGQPYLFSTEKMYRIYSAPDPSSPFYAQEVANSKGAVCAGGIVSGTVIFFIGRDGIYTSQGGQPYSVTDRDLYDLFPHDGQPGVSVRGIIPPDYSFSSTFQLEWYNDLLYFDYKGTDGNFYTLVLDGSHAPGSNAEDPDSGGWFLDTYNPAVRTHRGEEATSGVNLLAGGSDGKLYRQAATGGDLGIGIPFSFATRSLDERDPRVQKAWSDLALECNSENVTLTLTPQYNSWATSGTPVTGSNNARDLIPVSNLQQSRSVALLVEGVCLPGAAPKFYSCETTYYARPLDTTLAKTDYDDLGYPGAKWIQGCIIEADTFGATKFVEILRDENISAGITLSVDHDGMVPKPYSWQAFIASSVRLSPADSLPWQVRGIQWVWEPEPELTTDWRTQPMSFDEKGYLIIAGLEISLRSLFPVSVTITSDQMPAGWTGTIPATGGTQEKVFLRPGALKGKLFDFNLYSSGGFRLYQSDVEVWVRVWGSGDALKVVKPFGHPSHTRGALI